MNKEDLKERTKQFALQILRLVRGLPHDQEGVLSEDSFFDQPPLLLQIIEPRVVLVPLQSLLQKSLSLLKNQMSQHFGWNLSANLNS